MRPNGNQPGPQSILLKMRAMERILTQTSLLACYSRAIALGPDDHALPVITRRSEHSPHPQWCEVVGLAIHRRHGTWTHVYSCLLTPDARPIVHLVRVMEGERTDAAVDWIVAQAARPGALFARPPRPRPNPRIGSAARNGVAVESGPGRGVDWPRLSDQARILEPLVIYGDGRQPSHVTPAERREDGPVGLASARRERIPDTRRRDGARQGAIV